MGCVGVSFVGEDWSIRVHSVTANCAELTEVYATRRIRPRHTRTCSTFALPRHWKESECGRVAALCEWERSRLRIRTVFGLKNATGSKATERTDNGFSPTHRDAPLTGTNTYAVVKVPVMVWALSLGLGASTSGTAGATERRENAYGSRASACISRSKKLTSVNVDL